MTKTTFLPVLMIAALLCTLAPVASAGEATVPDCVGLSLDQARALVEKAGFKVRVTPQVGRPIGIVHSQNPGGFATRDTSTTIELKVGAPTPKPGIKPEPAPA